MPELPEVETVRRVLKDNLVGKTINNVSIRYNPIVENNDYFLENVIGKKIIDMKRYGKYLIFCLDKGYILSHLRMEGKYFYLENSQMDNKHIHVIFYLSSNSILYYQDVRKFGRMEYIETDIYNNPPLSLMGPDLVLNENIDIDKLYQKIHKSNKPIKEILLDQRVLSGLGNIYVDEVLYESRISPLRLGHDIKMCDIDNIIKESKRILLKAIEYKGTTIKSYTSSLGVKGSYQEFLQVHTKMLCPNCKMTLNRVKINGRMTYYCANCQR